VDSETVNEMLSSYVDTARKKNRVIAREDMAVSEHDDGLIEQEENDTQEGPGGEE